MSEQTDSEQGELEVISVDTGEIAGQICELFGIDPGTAFGFTLEAGGDCLTTITFRLLVVPDKLEQVKYILSQCKATKVEQ